jgi:hypothetical protein
MASRRTRARWATEAAQQALLRFSPEESGLAQLQQSALDTYRSGVQAAHSSAAGTVGAIDQARPQVAGAYKDEAGRQAFINSTVAHQTDGLSIPDAIKGALAVEQLAGATHASQNSARALTDLSRQRVAAKSGEQFATRQAHDTLVNDLTKVLERKQTLATEKGTFQSLTYGQLRKAAQDNALKVSLNNADNATSTANNKRTVGASIANSKRAAATARAKARGKTTATGAKLLSPDKHLEYSTAIHDLIGAVNKQKATGKGRHQIVDYLTKGAAARSGYATPNGTVIVKQGTGQFAKWINPQTGKEVKNAVAVPYHLPARSATKADIKLTAALDVAIDGHLSRATQKALQRAGFKVHDLNLPTYGQWKKRQRARTVPDRLQAPGANGQSRPG